MSVRCLPHRFWLYHILFLGGVGLTGGGGGCSLVVEKKLDDPADGPVCGNDKLEEGEQCDGPELGDTTCQDLGFDGGLLACGPDCTWDTADCDSNGQCGNGVIEGTEACDATNLGGESCLSLGFGPGDVVCDAQCDFDVSACGDPPQCGNDVKEYGEQCDTSDLGGATCQGEGLTGGTLACNAQCELVLAGCFDCGDALCEKDKGEIASICPEDCAWTAVSCGRYHACGLKGDRTVWCWGHNDKGQLGTGDTADRLVPTRVTASTPLDGITAGSQHTCGWHEGNKLWCWGANDNGQLGNGTTVDSTTPVAVSNIDSARFMSASISGWRQDHTCAGLVGGSVACWGGNNNGQLGDNTTSEKHNPAYTLVIDNADRVSVGVGFSCALQQEQAWCWGAGNVGQQGDGQSGLTHNSVIPTTVIGGHAFLDLDAGADHACGVDMGRVVWCWGGNAVLGNIDGRLGSAAVTQSATPIPLSDMSWNAEMVAAGGFHTCAVTQTAGVMCWGSNDFGECGNGHPSDTTSPVAVVAQSMDKATAVCAGWEFSCALTEAQEIFCWGRNHKGQLGNGTDSDSATPLLVLDPY